jgi:hypothetical protein
MASDALCKIGSTEKRVLSMFVHTRLPPKVTAQPAPRAVRSSENDGAKPISLQPKEEWNILYSLFAHMLDHDHAGQNPVRRTTAELLAGQTRSGFSRQDHHRQVESAGFAKAIFY